jgi:hypothetical protein
MRRNYTLALRSAMHHAGRCLRAAVQVDGVRSLG